MKTKCKVERARNGYAFVLFSLFGLLLVSVYLVFCIQLQWSTLCACDLHSGSQFCVSWFMGPIILVVKVVEFCIKPIYILDIFGFLKIGPLFLFLIFNSKWTTKIGIGLGNLKLRTDIAYLRLRPKQPLFMFYNFNFTFY